MLIDRSGSILNSKSTARFNSEKWQNMEISPIKNRKLNVHPGTAHVLTCDRAALHRCCAELPAFRSSSSSVRKWRVHAGGVPCCLVEVMARVRSCWTLLLFAVLCSLGNCLSLRGRPPQHTRPFEAVTSIRQQVDGLNDTTGALTNICECRTSPARCPALSDMRGEQLS